MSSVTVGYLEHPELLLVVVGVECDCGQQGDVVGLQLGDQLVHRLTIRGLAVSHVDRHRDAQGYVRFTATLSVTGDQESRDLCEASLIQNNVRLIPTSSLTKVNSYP